MIINSGIMPNKFHSLIQKLIRSKKFNMREFCSEAINIKILTYYTLFLQEVYNLVSDKIKKEHLIQYYVNIRYVCEEPLPMCKISDLHSSIIDQYTEFINSLSLTQINYSNLEHVTKLIEMAIDIEDSHTRRISVKILLIHVIRYSNLETMKIIINNYSYYLDKQLHALITKYHSKKN